MEFWDFFIFIFDFLSLMETYSKLCPIGSLPVSSVVRYTKN